MAAKVAAVDGVTGFVALLQILDLEGEVAGGESVAIEADGVGLAGTGWRVGAGAGECQAGVEEDGGLLVIHVAGGAEDVGVGIGDGAGLVGVDGDGKEAVFWCYFLVT
ncbi:MAG: hypothetical protein AB2766_12720 [Candidatus Thiodiazotropha endolucinida]